MKSCTSCGSFKSFSEFYKNKKSPDGYDWACKDCKKEEWKEYRLKNKDKIREYEAYRRKLIKRKAYVAEHSKEWREQHPEQQKALEKAWHEKNGKNRNEYFREYRKRKKKNSI